MIGALLFYILGGERFYKIPFTKVLYHDILGWHYPKKEVGFDGCSYISCCAICNKKIMQDSQGNWF